MLRVDEIRFKLKLFIVETDFFFFKCASSYTGSDFNLKLYINIILTI